MKKLLAVIAVAVAVPASAEINWNADLMGQFKAGMAQGAVKVAPVAALELSSNVEEPISIEAVAVHGNTITAPRRYNRTSLRFVLNNTQDRVGAELELCEDRMSGGDDTWCETLTYSLPQLSYDKKSKEIRLGSEVIEVRGTFVWGQWKNPKYKLSFTATPSMKDLGFNRVDQTTYRVFLKKASK